MDIVSCENCGVLFNRNNIKFPENVLNPDGSYNLDVCAWSDVVEDYVAFVRCPVCRIGIILAA